MSVRYAIPWRRVRKLRKEARSRNDKNRKCFTTWPHIKIKSIRLFHFSGLFSQKAGEGKVLREGYIQGTDHKDDQSCFNCNIRALGEGGKTFLMAECQNVSWLKRNQWLCIVEEGTAGRIGAAHTQTHTDTQAHTHTQPQSSLFCYGPEWFS